MSEGASTEGGAGAHVGAAESFARRVGNEIAEVEELYCFGSTVRGEAAGIASDVDFFGVVSDDASQEQVTERLRDVAYDVMLDFGPVVEVHVRSRSTFERRRDADHPFVANAVAEDERHV